MASRPDLDDDDDDFSDIYKAYTGPIGTSAAKMQEQPQTNNKRSPPSSDEEEERDPNAVPTDFTSREARVWEAKSKATERNWKKRKEEEMICKICGESGHFTQGCPSTLGGNRNSQDFFERVAARDKNVRALFTAKVIEGIEKDIGCKIRMDEKFIIVSGKDRLVLRKGVDAVHKVIKGEGNDKGSHGSVSERSKSSERSPIGGNHRFSRSESQRSNPSPRDTSHFPKFGRQRSLEDRIRDDLQKPSRNSPKARAYGSDEGRVRSRSPARVSYSGNSYNAYEPHRQGMGGYRSDVWETERRGSELHADSKFEQPSFPQTLEDLEREYQREAMDLARLRDQQVDEENYKHNEISRELREAHMKRLAALQGSHTKQWQDFLHMNELRHQQQLQNQQMSTTSFGGYQHSSFADRDSFGSQPYPGSNFHKEPRGHYASPSGNYTHSRPHDAYDDFQQKRLEGVGRSYDRY